MKEERGKRVYVVSRVGRDVEEAADLLVLLYGETLVLSAAAVALDVEDGLLPVRVRRLGGCTATAAQSTETCILYGV